MIQSKKIDRYNDDFALKFTNDSKFISVNNNLSEITSSQDWSISFYCLKEDNTTQVIIDTRNVGNSFDAWEIVFINDHIVFYTGIGNTFQTVYTFNQYSFVDNVFNHVVFNFDSSTSNLNLYVNGSFKQFININSSIIPSSVNLFKFGEFLLGSNIIPLKGLLRDFSTYDKQLSEDEITYIYKTGVPPISAYSNIQHYYPLNQIPTETSGNYFMSDKAESFNSSATNSEAELIGWTTDEIGISNPSRISSFKDFYTKNQYYGIGIKYDGLSPDKMSGLTPDITPVDFTNGYTVVVKMFLDTLNSVRSDILYQSGQPNNGIYVRYNPIGSFEVSNGASWNLQTENYRFKLVTVVAVVSLTTTALYVNGRTANYPAGIYNPNPINTTYPTSITGACLLGSIFSSRECKGVYFTGLFNKTLTPQEVSETSKNEDWLILNPTFFYSSENNGTEYIDQSGNLGNATINDPTYFQSNQKYSNLGGVTYNNYQKGLNFDSSKQQYLEVTGLEAFDNTKGWTIISGFNNLTTDNTNFIYFGDGLTYEANNPRISYFSGDIGGTHTLLGGGGNTVKINTNVIKPNLISYWFSNVQENYYDGNQSRTLYSNGLSQRNATSSSSADPSNGNGGFVSVCKFSNSYTSLRMSFLSVVRGVITDEEYKKIYNNGIYRSPYEVLEDTSKIILDVDFQNPFVDGTDIKFTDNSGNCEVIAKQNSGTDWSTLLGVQNSID